MVPDGRVTLRMAELFVELKFLHWGTTTYSDAHLRHASRCRSVTVRAAKVHGEYVKKASDLDAKFCGTSAAERPGPVESRLAAFGTVRPMVVGHYGELSPFLEELIDAADDSGAEKHWRRMRCDSPAIARGFIAQMLRRSWGMGALARLVTRVRGAAVPNVLAFCLARVTVLGAAAVVLTSSTAVVAFRSHPPRRGRKTGAWCVFHVTVP
jgi:hypothetical protein